MTQKIEITKNTVAKGMMEFIKNSPTAFHAVEQLESELKSKGFKELQEANKWSLQKGKKYYVKRGESSLIAFRLASGDKIKGGFKIVGAHTDCPALKVKPNPVVKTKNYLQLGVEVYGGMILSTWFDRDLSLAGRVSYETKKGELKNVLVDFKRAVGVIPSLAIHLGRDVNDKRSINKQKEMPPLVMQMSSNGDLDFDQLLIKEIKKNNKGIDIVKVLASDLYFYDHQDPSFVGFNKDFICSSRLDNLLSCYLGMESLAKAGTKSTALLVCNDHEECGSESFVGASGTFLKDVLERISGSRENLIRTISNSLLISADNAHALHPNYAERHEPAHTPLINGGPVIKINANLRYATSSDTGARFIQLCEKAEVPYQKFVIRTDMPCGSTIGPITSTALGIKTIDIGAPTYGMHSIRELVGANDPYYIYKVLAEFFKG